MTPGPSEPTRPDVLPDEGLGTRVDDLEAEALKGLGSDGADVEDEGLPTGWFRDVLPLKTEYDLPGADEGDRERALPVRQGDLTRLLLSDPDLSAADREALENFGRLLGATFHHEFYATLRDLKERYAPLDPDSDYVPLAGCTPARSSRSDDEFLVPFESVMARANYRPLPVETIRQAISAPNETGLTYVPNLDLFEHLRVFVRGYTRITRDCRNVRTRFRKRPVTLEAYQRLVVALKFKEGQDLGPLVRDDVLYLRMFKDVPHVDMEMHLPEQGTKVRMRLIDKAQIASPIFVGIPTILMKVLAVTISPMALGGLVLAPISAGINSFFGFQRAKQKHLYSMIYRLYYLTLANNASVLTRLIDSAEDEEYKEAMLAYYFLWRGPPAGGRWKIEALDLHIEEFLREKTGVVLDFEVSDAVSKLFRLGVARRDADGHPYVVPPGRALEILDRRWDNVFKFNRQGPDDSSTP